MVVKIYISGMSGNKEVKKRQQRVLLILDSKHVKYDVIDIAEPGSEEQKDFMQSNSTSNGATIGDANPRHPLPPQIFNDSDYCGDYDLFDMANEIDEMEKFLKLNNDEPVTSSSNAEIKIGNGDVVVEKEEEKVNIDEKEKSPIPIENGNGDIENKGKENGETTVENDNDQNVAEETEVSEES